METFLIDNNIEFVSDFSWIDWVGEDEEQYDTLGELLVSIFKGEA